jgi:hypothetical protein
MPTKLSLRNYKKGTNHIGMLLEEYHSKRFIKNNLPIYT